VCSTSKNKKYLEDIAKDLGITSKNDGTRTAICDQIKNKMMFLEKHGTKKNKNKITYVMIPANHAIYPFPYNLEDRVEFIQEKIKTNIMFKLDMSTETEKQTKKGDDHNHPIYKIIIKDDIKLKEYHEFLSSVDAKLNNNKWTIMIE
jgi:predicted GH43/DUF377 family glycosyl hydrolase